MKAEIEKFLKNKKNKRMIFWLLGVIILYFALKKKEVIEESEVGYSSLGAGSYTGGTKVVIPPVVTNPNTENTIVSTGSRRVYMDSTGYGFDPKDSTGIHNDWREKLEAFRNMNYNGITFSAINGFSMTMKWSDYEPSEGVFNDAALRNAINWCRARGLKLAIIFWALRSDSGASMIPNSDKATGANGEIYYEEGKYTLAPWSMIGRNKIENTFKHLAQVLKEYPDDTDYVAFAMGNTSEYYLPMIKTIEVVNGVMVIRNDSMTGYSQVDKAAWVTYAASHNLAGTLPPVSPNANNAFETGNLWTTTAGRAWYEFITDGLAGLHAAFVRGVVAGGGKPCGFFADAGGAQSAWYGTYHLQKIFAGVQVAYSSEGGNIYDYPNKWMAIDLMKATFPNAEPGFEVDQEDIAANPGNTSYGAPINGELLYKIMKSAFERGAKIGHFAMAFSPGNIAQMASAMYRIQNEFIKAGSVVTPTPIGETINFQLNSLSGDAGYRGQWKAAGGGENKQVKILLS